MLVRRSPRLRRFSTAVADRFAGRYALGQNKASVAVKDSLNFMRDPGGQATRVIGGACSEVLGGKNLAALLRPGFELEMRAMVALERGDPAEALSIHTSAGVPEQLATFIDALEPHVPGRRDDWCVNLQAEGASAVHAAVDMVLQAGDAGAPLGAKGVAVGQTSYHGPPSTSPGGEAPLGSRAKGLTLEAQYPVPTPFFRRKGEPDDAFHARMLAAFGAYLDAHAHEIGVLLIEPQWGSSAAAMPWPPALLRAYVAAARERGLPVVADEIMCGLGRHGQEPSAAAGGTGCFLSECWGLDVDAVTFGKAIGGGAGHLLSGAVLLRGARRLQAAPHGTALQSHTYAGSSARALLNGATLLDALPVWRPNVQALGEVIGPILAGLEEASGGALICHGQGAKWGGLFAHEDAAARAAADRAFKAYCAERRVLPYFCPPPSGGFMLTPRYDDDPAAIGAAVQDLADCALRAARDMGWSASALMR